MHHDGAAEGTLSNVGPSQLEIVDCDLNIYKINLSLASSGRGLVAEACSLELHDETTRA